MSESSISTYITRTTGLSFFDLLNEMRIGKTINFLLYTDFTLEELAEILGFVDSAHISKVFSARVLSLIHIFPGCVAVQVKGKHNRAFFALRPLYCIHLPSLLFMIIVYLLTTV